MIEKTTIRPIGKTERFFAIHHEDTQDYIHFLRKDEKGNAFYGLRPGREGAALWKGMREALNMLKYFEEFYENKILKLEPVHKNSITE